MNTRNLFSTLTIIATLAVPMFVANQAQAGHRHHGYHGQQHRDYGHHDRRHDRRHHRQHRRHKYACPTRHYKRHPHNSGHGKIGYRYYDRNSGFSVLFNF